MNEIRKQWLVRTLAGGVLGMVILFFIGGIFNGLVNGAILGGRPFRGISPDLIYLVRSTPLAAAIQFALYFALGALVGIATLPFADNGKTLVICSLLHFFATAAVFSVLSWLCWWCWSEWKVLLVELGLLALLYVLIWLGRLAAWWSELDAIREKLGLDPVPSPLRWRESLPSLGFALLLCFGLPLALRFFDPPDVPALTAILWPLLLVPVGGFMGGLSLGRRHGVCPLYPAACALLALAATLLLNNSVPLVNAGIALAAALAGNLAGVARRKMKRKASGTP